MKNDSPLSIPRHQIKRLAERGSYDPAGIAAVIDASPIGHVGFVHDGFPMVIPMAIWRDGDFLYLHSANKGRLASVCAGANLCVAITHLDGLVLAHSAFDHSMNYRSVVVHGVAEPVLDPGAKLAALKTFVDGLFPGRWDTLRPIKENELNATVVLRIPLAMASLKRRTGMPHDDEADRAWPVWTGILPLRTAYGPPEPAMTVEQPLPDYLKR